MILENGRQLISFSLIITEIQREHVSLHAFSGWRPGENRAFVFSEAAWIIHFLGQEFVISDNVATVAKGGPQNLNCQKGRALELLSSKVRTRSSFIIRDTCTWNCEEVREIWTCGKTTDSLGSHSHGNLGVLMLHWRPPPPFFSPPGQPCHSCQHS